MHDRLVHGWTAYVDRTAKLQPAAQSAEASLPGTHPAGGAGGGGAGADSDGSEYSYTGSEDDSGGSELGSEGLAIAEPTGAEAQAASESAADEPAVESAAAAAAAATGPVPAQASTAGEEFPELSLIPFNRDSEAEYRLKMKANWQTTVLGKLGFAPGRSWKEQYERLHINHQEHEAAGAAKVHRKVLVDMAKTHKKIYIRVNEHCYQLPFLDLSLPSTELPGLPFHCLSLGLSLTYHCLFRFQWSNTAPATTSASSGWRSPTRRRAPGRAQDRRSGS